MRELIAIIGISILYLFLIIYFFNLFKKLRNLIILVIILLIFKFWVFKIVNLEYDFLNYLILIGLFISIKIHSYLFHMRSPTLHLSEIIYENKLKKKSKIKNKFLKHKFISYYINILVKQKILLIKKNYYILTKKGFIFYQFYKVFFKILIR